MPCVSYGPSSRPYTSKTARNLKYVLKTQGEPIPEWVDRRTQYSDCGVTKEIQDKLTKKLCKLCKKMSDKEKMEIMYDGSSKKARRLAIWWAKHQKADKERRRRKREKAEKKELKKSAASKLSKKERKAIGLS